MIATRGAPMMSLAWRARSTTAGHASDRPSASPTATPTSSQAAKVVRRATRSLAAISAALVSGRVARNGDTPYA